MAEINDPGSAVRDQDEAASASASAAASSLSSGDDESAATETTDLEEDGDGDGDADTDDEEDYSQEDRFKSTDVAMLPALPEENDPKYPQEDAKYFRTKNYVRKDKYELGWFFLQHKDDIAVEIPHLIEAFNKKGRNQKDSRVETE